MNNKYMKRAIELSVKSVNSGTGPFGAVIVKDNQIISEGFNTVTLNNDPTSHAEIVAIRIACKELGNFSLEYTPPKKKDEFQLNSFLKSLPKKLNNFYTKKSRSK